MSARTLIRQQAVFGGADGLVLLVGLVIGLHRHPAAMFAAATGAGLAELVGMTTGAMLSGTGRLPSLANGVAALAACVVPALPYTFASGWAALGASLAVAAVVAGVIAWLRPDQGLLAVVETYGVLVGAAVLCYLASLIGA